MSTLDHIPAFHAVMTHGSLSAAARALGLAQPTVRRQIEAFEADLGTSLFTRAANGLTPTEMAHTLLPMAQGVIDEGQALIRAASARAHGLEGVVRLTCSRIVATHVLPPLLAEMRAELPDIRFEVAATDRPENLARRAADIAVRFTPPVQQALVAAKLPNVELGLFTAPHGPRVKGPDDLRDTPFLSDDRDDQILPALAQFGLPVPRRIVMRSDDPLTLIGALQAGLGISICQVKLAARLGLIRQLPDVTHGMPAWLVVHEDQSRIARIARVFDHLKTGLPTWM